MNAGGDSRRIEELTFNAWPPLERLLFDGWVLGFSNGYTRRANSVQPLYRSSLEVADKILACEAEYAARGLPPIFKITSASPDVDLDSDLAKRGYVLSGTTSVQVADLAGLDVDTDPSVSVASNVSDEWCADFNRLTGTPPKLHAAERRLLEQIIPTHGFASMRLDGQTVAVGLSVAEHGYVGLFDIVVDARVRGQGLGRRLCASLLAWGRAEHAAHTAYLAVVQDNTPALRLYAQLSFREVYTYWYRQPG